MALPEVPEVARALLARLGPKAYAALEAMLDDPKVAGRDRLAVIKLVLDRYHPEPKIDSAAGARRPAVMLTAVQTDVSALMSRAQQRIASQPVELIAAELETEQGEPEHE